MNYDTNQDLVHIGSPRGNAHQGKQPLKNYQRETSSSRMKFYESRNTSGSINLDEPAEIKAASSGPQITATAIGSTATALRPLKKPTFTELRNKLKSEKIRR